MAQVEIARCKFLCCNGLLLVFHLGQVAQVNQVTWHFPNPSSAQRNFKKMMLDAGGSKTPLRVMGITSRSRRLPRLLHQPTFRHQLPFLASQALIFTPLDLTYAADVDMADFAWMVWI